MMSSTIKELTLLYDPVNETNTFTNGDVLQGRVFLEVSKEANINSFYIKFKGDANVRWSERRNDRTHTYSSHERYFKLKQFFIMDPSKQERKEPNVITTNRELYGNVIRPGRHVFPFRFQLPDGDMPPSFKGCHGSVKYILEARLDRSWMIDKTAVTEIQFVPKIAAGAKIMVGEGQVKNSGDGIISRAVGMIRKLQGVQWVVGGVSDFMSPMTNLFKHFMMMGTPQRAAVDKKMTLFTSGSASMTATIDKRSYMQGDVIRVSTNVDNSSSRELKLKYSLQQKQIFHAQGHTNYSLETIFKLVGDPIPKGSKKTVNTDLIMPSDVDYNFENCSIIKLEYTFKVYLDVPYASDPAIRFPVIILAAGQPCKPRPPAQTVYGPSPPSQAAFDPSLPGATYRSSPRRAAYRSSPPRAAYRSSPPRAAYRSSPPRAAYRSSPPRAAYRPSPPRAAFGPAPPLYPSPAYPQPANPSSPPPLYTDIYPDQNPLFPAFQSASSAPALSPPSYSSVSYPGPAGQAASTPGFWPNSAHPSTQPESYPTKPPEKHV